MPRHPRREVPKKGNGPGSLPKELLIYLAIGHDFSFGAYTTPTGEMKDPAEMRRVYFSHRDEIIAYAAKDRPVRFHEETELEKRTIQKPWAYFVFELDDELAFRHQGDPSADYRGAKIYLSTFDVPPFARGPLRLEITHPDGSRESLDPGQMGKLKAELFPE